MSAAHRPGMICSHCIRVERIATIDSGLTREIEPACASTRRECKPAAARLARGAGVV
jgi:hypothetical protein